MALSIKPMLMHDAPGKAFDLPGSASGWIIEFKWDGWRWLIEVCEDGVHQYAGRNATDWTGSAAAVAEAGSFLPVGTILDCEIVAIEPGVAVATALAHDLPVQAIAFDVLSVGPDSTLHLPWSERRALLEAAGAGFDGTNLTLSEVHPADEAIHDRWVSGGGEGSVAKRTDSIYRPGKRTRDWLKIKPQATAEARIIGFKAGNNGLAGEVGAFKIRMLDTGAETSVATTGEQMVEVKVRPEDFLGHVIEVKHHGRTKEGKMRHPIFSRMRPDRDEAAS